MTRPRYTITEAIHAARTMLGEGASANDGIRLLFGVAALLDLMAFGL